LKISSVKDKIEPWIADWENLRLQMISLKLQSLAKRLVVFPFWESHTFF
jgi:hypothetical protein